MVKLPEPPTPNVLRSIPAEIHMIPAGKLLWRVHPRAGAHPTSWNEFRTYGPVPTSRFDHHVQPPGSQPRGILYAAESVRTCIAEYFQETRTIDTKRGSPSLVAFRLVRDVAALNLRGTWPTRAGASMNINSGPRGMARAWSRTIHEAYPGVAGVLYCSSMNANEPAVALYERASAALPAAPEFNRPLSDPDLIPVLEQAAHRFGYALLLPDPGPVAGGGSSA